MKSTAGFALIVVFLVLAIISGALLSAHSYHYATLKIQRAISYYVNPRRFYKILAAPGIQRSPYYCAESDDGAICGISGIQPGVFNTSTIIDGRDSSRDAVFPAAFSKIFTPPLDDCGDSQIQESHLTTVNKREVTPTAAVAQTTCIDPPSSLRTISSNISLQAASQPDATFYSLGYIEIEDLESVGVITLVAAGDIFIHRLALAYGSQFIAISLTGIISIEGGQFSGLTYLAGREGVYLPAPLPNGTGKMKPPFDVPQYFIPLFLSDPASKK